MSAQLRLKADQALPGGVGVEVVETSSLGDRSYLATDGELAIVVDPQRDSDRVIATAGRLGVRIVLVAETHVHNDYISGGLELSRLTGAVYAAAAADELPFTHRPVSDSDVLTASDRMWLRVVATPGHTYHHLSYVLEGTECPVGAFTGGSLLFGTTGRTDLVGAGHSRELAGLQHSSARTLAGLLPEGAQVWSTHGFGSFCAAGAAAGDAATVGEEKQRNPALILASEEFVEQTLAGLDVYPAYYVHMGLRNVAGPDPIDLRPPAVASPFELARRLDSGEWVVDLRSRKAYVVSHLVGTVSLGLDGPMTTWLGSLLDWAAPLTLLGESPEDVAEAQRELARIGIDHFAVATGSPEVLATDRSRLRGMPSASFAELAAARRGERGSLPPPEVVLDVRSNSEYRASHIDAAVHIPLYELNQRLAEVPAGAVWTHCGSGYRAAAASLLQDAGRTVVLIDDNFSAAGETDLSLQQGEQA